MRTYATHQPYIFFSFLYIERENQEVIQSIARNNRESYLFGNYVRYVQIKDLSEVWQPSNEGQKQIVY
jgi:hypothetical protein